MTMTINVIVNIIRVCTLIIVITAKMDRNTNFNNKRMDIIRIQIFYKAFFNTSSGRFIYASRFINARVEVKI